MRRDLAEDPPERAVFYGAAFMCSTESVCLASDVGRDLPSRITDNAIGNINQPLLRFFLKEFSERKALRSWTELHPISGEHGCESCATSELVI